MTRTAAITLQGDVFLAARDQLVQESIQTECLPQLPAQAHITKTPAPFEPQTFHGQGGGASAHIPLFRG
jgi:hypothetical protein